MAPGLPMETSIAGLRLRNPFGLAAGFDKNGEITAAVVNLGFGFVVVGSVRAFPHPGNPRPWMVRRLREKGLVNAMGLPSKGADRVRERLKELDLNVPLLVSLVGEDTSDLMNAYQQMEGTAAGWEVNLSCPNTATGRSFEDDLDAFEDLLAALREIPGPVFLKLSPYQDERGRERAMEMAGRAVKRGLRYFTLCNTLPVEERRLGIGRGGLSGRPLFPLSLQAVRDFYEEWGEEVEIIGVGGVLTGTQAYEMMAAGARAVEVLTALILRGPFVARHLVVELEQTMRDKGLRSVDEMVGRGV